MQAERDPVCEAVTVQITEKKELRRQAVRLRDQLSETLRREKSLLLQKNMIQSELWKGAQTVYLYASFRSEAETAFLWEQARREKKRTAFPRIDKKNMDFYLVEGPHELASGLWGILEPVEGCPSIQEERPLILVPGLLFSEDGYRLGYGGGYYDRYLAAHPWAVSCGLAFEEQLRQELPCEAFDEPLGAICTDRGLILCHRQGASLKKGSTAQR